jgi:hypothetical protein
MKSEVETDSISAVKFSRHLAIGRSSENNVKYEGIYRSH